MYYTSSSSSSSSSSEGSVDDERLVSSGEEESGLDMMKRNDPRKTRISYVDIQHVTEEESWEELGRDISNNTHLEIVELCAGALDEHKVSLLFRGLTRSSSIIELDLNDNGFSVPGVRSMVPFLENANNFTYLCVNDNNIQSEGFNIMFRALRDSPIDMLHCDRCGIGSIEIDTEHIPKNLTYLSLIGNIINANGCHELAKLLQGGDSTLKDLYLRGNTIDDEGVAILVAALQRNTSLETLNLRGNDAISKQGKVSLLRLVCNISSIESTLQSNHTLRDLWFKSDEEIQRHINIAVRINNRNDYNQEAAGREKVIQTQLHSGTRAALCRLQGIDHVVYGDISPLHLPEVLSSIGRSHGQGELYNALKSSIAGVISTVNMKKCIQQLRVTKRLP
mmetsp:Transcript_20019/g.40140  ORF Transcript_20019/g.40140 Transcript_20019/m.40140 type:complete len:393 (+) Transcript_20019:35-1213(+)